MEDKSRMSNIEIEIKNKKKSLNLKWKREDIRV